MKETKSEIRARIDELRRLERNPDFNRNIRDAANIRNRIKELEAQMIDASEDLFKGVMNSHTTLCAVKEMDEKAAYGQDPAMYYALGVCGEAGEMANKIVKSLRNGNDPEAAKNAVISELPDVFIYGAVLAYVLDIDITKLVHEKVEIITERARSGYYGGPLKTSPDSTPVDGVEGESISVKSVGRSFVRFLLRRIESNIVG